MTFLSVCYQDNHRQRKPRQEEVGDNQLEVNAATGYLLLWLLVNKETLSSQLAVYKVTQLRLNLNRNTRREAWECLSQWDGYKCPETWDRGVKKNKTHVERIRCGAGNYWWEKENCVTQNETGKVTWFICWGWKRQIVCENVETDLYPGTSSAQDHVHVTKCLHHLPGDCLLCVCVCVNAALCSLSEGLDVLPGWLMDIQCMC